jgi:hypothetical protein
VTVVAQTAEEDRKGRSLLVDTTNLDGRPLIWDMIRNAKQ